MDPNAKVITEEDLMKSIQALEAKPEEKVVEQTTEVKAGELKKSAADKIEEGASAELKGALDVSSTLSEFATLIGAHVDESLDTLAKSVQASAERDLGIVRVLSDLKKSIDALKESVEKFGDQPAGKTAVAVVTKEDVLNKAAGKNEEGKPDPVKLRKTIASGLEKLAKSATPGSPEATQYLNAAVKFESTGQISEGMLAEVRKQFTA